MYRTNWGIGHSMKEILEAHKGPFTGEGHVGLYEILTTSWHAQLAINLALFGSLSIIVAHHMYAMPPYPYLATDYGTQLSLFTHHVFGGFCIVGAGAAILWFVITTNNYNNLLDRVIRHRDAIISLKLGMYFLRFPAGLFSQRYNECIRSSSRHVLRYSNSTSACVCTMDSKHTS
jgi:photosystem I P700 chlorophyll a apoprotein A1